jgi:hypothetical protein
MYEAEHGPSGNDGPGGGDEVNHITQDQTMVGHWFHIKKL